MRSRLNRTSVCFRRFAERKSLTFGPVLGAADRAHCQKLTSGQSLPDKSIGLFGEITVDALVFEFMGLAMFALCFIVLAVPTSRRPAGRHARDF